MTMTILWYVDHDRTVQSSALFLMSLLQYLKPKDGLPYPPRDLYQLKWRFCYSKPGGGESDRIQEC